MITAQRAFLVGRFGVVIDGFPLERDAQCSRVVGFFQDSSIEKGSQAGNVENSASEEYAEALKYYEKGQGPRAMKVFNRIYRKYGDYRKTGNYIHRIEKSEHDYIRAEEYLQRKNFYSAIPLLEKIAEHLPEAKLKLAETRLMLMPDKKRLEKKAKELYYAEKYERCIMILNKVKLIDPSSQVVSLYLPRARKRYQSYEKFK